MEKSQVGHDPNEGHGPGMPRWVKVSGIVVGVLLVLVVAMVVLGGGEHGPGRHSPGMHRPAAPSTAPLLGMVP